MKNFVHNVIAELKSDSDLNNNSLVKMVVESTERSILYNNKYENIYTDLRKSLTGVNEHLNNDKIKSFLDQFKKNDETQDSKISDISKRANLASKLNLIKESNAYSNPLIFEKVNRYQANLDKTNEEYKLYPGFISEFEIHAVEESVSKAISEVKSILEQYASDYELMYAISLMESVNTSVYSSIIPELKTMLVEGKYTSDIINLKFGETGLPYVKTLVNNLKVVESKTDKTFTLGAGNADTIIRDVIAPAEKTKNGLVAFLDNRFIKISENTKADGSETEVHVNEGVSISTLNPSWVSENHPELYNIAEAFAVLGFKESELNEGVESRTVRNFAISLTPNLKGDFDVLINGSNVGDAKSVNLTEALAMESTETRKRVELIFENLSKIYTLGFIKNVSNVRTLSEATVFELSNNYVICDKKNAAERDWLKVDEMQMFNFFNDKFQYDISPIFGTQINESIETSKKIEESKKSIQADINKLETSIVKLDEAINAKGVGADDVAKLEEIKESIEQSISKLKEEYIKYDLTKKSINENKKDKDAYCQKHFGCDYADCNKKQKAKCDKECK